MPSPSKPRSKLRHIDFVSIVVMLLVVGVPTAVALAV